MRVKNISKGLVFILALSFALMSGSPKCYASEGSGTESQTNTESGSGQSLYDALSRIYGEYRNSGSTVNNESSSSSSESYSSKSTEVDGTEELMQEMETELKGPKVNESGISEQYHESYKVYEESINDDISIFTNIANGSVVNHAVVMEIPEGIVARMKRNGKSVPIISEEPISEEGSYVVTFYVMDEDQEELPFSQQAINKAKFRFRIQYGTGVAGYEAVDDSKPDFSSKIPDFSGLTYNEDGSVSGNISGGFKESISSNETVSGDSLLFGDEDDNYLPEDLREDDYEYDLTKSNETEKNNEEKNAEEDTNTTGEASFLAENGVSGEYDSDSGFYKNTTLSNEIFYTNVPNGMLTNDPVMIQKADNLTYTLYRNGEAYEDFTPGQYISDEGSYLLKVVSKENEKPALFRFRIIVNPVSNMGIVNAPENTSFRTVRYEGEDVSSSAIIRTETIRLMQDGNYEITMDTPGGSSELILSLDTIQPNFRVALQPNIATIEYKSDDISYCTLYRNGNLVSDSTIINEVTQPGEYDLTAYDRAGNKAEAKFHVSYRINAGAVVAILLILALIGGIIAYILRVKKKFNIR